MKKTFASFLCAFGALLFAYGSFRGATGHFAEGTWFAVVGLGTWLFWSESK